jgi:hypothetical protein
MPDINRPLDIPEPILKDKTRPPLPYPDKVPETPITQGFTSSAAQEKYTIGKNDMAVKKNPGLAERLWCNRWNLVRHFILTGAAAAITAWTTSKSWTVAGGAFVIGGVAGVVRKGGDDELRAATGADSLSLIASALSGAKKEGAMSIRIESEQFGDALGTAVIRATDDVPNSTEIGTLVGDAMKAFTEGADFAKMPKADRLNAAMLGLATAMKKIADEKIKFTDEVVPPPTT